MNAEQLFPHLPYSVSGPSSTVHGIQPSTLPTLALSPVEGFQSCTVQLFLEKAKFKKTNLNQIPTPRYTPCPPRSSVPRRHCPRSIINRQIQTFQCSNVPTFQRSHVLTPIANRQSAPLFLPK
jgi:hypothetical protein